MTQTEYMLELLKTTDKATGADISKWNGTWDLSKVDMDIFSKVMDFTILRIGYGAADGTVVKDPQLEANYAILEKYPTIMRAGYWYLSSHSSWSKQFNAMVGYIGGKDLDFYVLDFENLYNTPGLPFNTTAVKFLRATAAKFPDKKVFIYAGRYNYVELWADFPEIDNYPYWVAQYPWKNWTQNFTEYFKQWWAKVFTSYTQGPTLPSHKSDTDWEIWQVIASSGIGLELGFGTDNLDFNVSRRNMLEFYNWIGRPARWTKSEAEPAGEYTLKELAEAKQAGRKELAEELLEAGSFIVTKITNELG